MFKLNIHKLENLIKVSQSADKTKDPVKQVTELGLASSCTIYVFDEKNQWSGSGFHIGEGNIITAAHVVPKRVPISEVKISFDNKNFYNADILVSESNSDVAVLNCPQITKSIPALNLGNSDMLEVGDLVIIVSAPEGFHDTVTYGRVSNIHQSVKGANLPAWSDIIFIDAEIMEGSSGGMVLGIDGLVYGIVIGVTGSHADLGIGESSVSPSNKIQSVLQSLK